MALYSKTVDVENQILTGTVSRLLDGMTPHSWWSSVGMCVDCVFSFTLF